MRAIGIDVIGVPGYEAEDVIDTLAAQISGTVEIASGDRDLFALVENPRVRVLYPEKPGLAVIDEAEITRRYEIPGRRYADFAILRGVRLRAARAAWRRRVGAAAMIRRHGDIVGVLRERELRAADREYLERAARIVPSVVDRPIQLPAGRREAYPADPAALDALVERYRVREPVDGLLAALRTPSEDAARSA